MANAHALLSVLSDSTRHLLVESLRKGPLTVGELAARVPVTRSAVSQHLKVLKAAGLVEDEPSGTKRLYRLRAQTLGELRVYLDALWGDALTSFAREAAAETRGARKRRTP